MTRLLALSAALILALAGALLLLNSYLTDPVEAALAAAARNQAEEAGEQTQLAAERLEAWQLADILVPSAEARLESVELWLLYRDGRYDDVLNRAVEAPTRARPHFWRASAQFQKGIQSEEKENALIWLRQSEEQFLKSLRLFPDHWNTKFNYELVHRLVKSLEDPQEPPPVRVLRPKPEQGKAPPARKG